MTQVKLMDGWDNTNRCCKTVSKPKNTRFHLFGHQTNALVCFHKQILLQSFVQMISLAIKLK